MSDDRYSCVSYGNRKRGYYNKYKFIYAFFIILIIFILVFSFSACNGATSDFEYSNLSKDAYSFTAEDDPVIDISSDGSIQTVMDCIGRKVDIPAEPEKVAVLDSFSGEAAVLMGGGPQIATCPNGTKSDLILAEIAPEITDVPVIMSGGAFNAESLISLGADIVLVKLSLYQAEGEKEKLESLGIPYLVVDYSSMQEQIYALRMVGTAFGSEAADRADRIAEYYSSVIERAQEISSGIPDSQKMRVYHSINQVVMTDGADSIGNDWITCVGALDVSAGNEAEMKFENNDYYAGLEQIFKWDPDVVICNEASTKDYLLTDSKWTELRAVRENKVYNIPVSATRWGQRGSVETYLAILWLGTTIYPEYYSSVDLRKEVADYYSNVIGINIDDNMWEKIISGQGIRNSSNNSGS